MGGQRFKSLDVTRITADAYHRFEPIMIDRLASLGIQAESPKTFPGKTSYGDMDLVASEEELLAHAGEPRTDKTPRAAAIENLGIKLGALATASTGPLDHATSFAIPTPDGEIFQIDLITHPAEVVDYARRFYSWGDTGALLSVTARALGLRNKATGLHYIAGYSTDQLDIPLHVTFDEALEVLGFDVDKHRLGFEDQDEVFAWLMAGRNFDPRVYDVSYLTERNRRRSRVRPMQATFQNICNDLTSGNATHPRRYDGQTDAERYADMAPYRARTAARFPFIREIEAAHIARFEEKNKKKAFYSAERLNELTGFTGEDIKLLMWQLTKDDRFGSMMKSKDTDVLAEMVSDMLAWRSAIQRLSSEAGSSLHRLVWEITNSGRIIGKVADHRDEQLLVLIKDAYHAIAEADAKRDQRAQKEKHV